MGDDSPVSLLLFIDSKVDNKVDGSVCVCGVCVGVVCFIFFVFQANFGFWKKRDRVNVEKELNFGSKCGLEWRTF